MEAVEKERDPTDDPVASAIRVAHTTDDGWCNCREKIPRVERRRRPVTPRPISSEEESDLVPSVQMERRHPALVAPSRLVGTVGTVLDRAGEQRVPGGTSSPTDVTQIARWD